MAIASTFAGVGESPLACFGGQAPEVMTSRRGAIAGRALGSVAAQPQGRRGRT